jgi:hypothetical protein
METPMFSSDRVTITLSNEEALRTLMLSLARGVRRQRAGVPPAPPSECPRCLAPIDIAVSREPASRLGADDWDELYYFKCERCGFAGQRAVGWPKDKGLSLSDYLWGPHADLGEEYRGSWDAQRRARERETRLDYNPWYELQNLTEEHHLNIGGVLDEARLAGLFEHTGDVTEPEFEALKTAFALLDGKHGSDEKEGDES